MEAVVQQKYDSFRFHKLYLNTLHLDNIPYHAVTFKQVS